MSTDSVVKLNYNGPQGQEFFLVVDFSTKKASVLMIDPRNGNIVVTDVQPFTQRGG